MRFAEVSKSIPLTVVLKTLSEHLPVDLEMVIYLMSELGSQMNYDISFGRSVDYSQDSDVESSINT
jgi:hypothetical protein